jgi:uncharacterized protein
MGTGAMIAGLTLGLVSSFHCVGMCGPLTFALPLRRHKALYRFTALLLYQLGRIVTYAAVGFLFGLVGRRIYIQGYQQWFSTGLGVVVLFMALLYFLHRYDFHVPFLKGFYVWVQKIISSLLQKVNNLFGFFAMGMANGLLPCGMVYIALITTLSFTTLAGSISFMAMFGMGTLPAMMLVGMAGQFVKPSVRSSMQKAVPWFVVLVGVVLVLRGMNLGIPFVSPALPGEADDAVICHP